MIAISTVASCQAPAGESLTSAARATRLTITIGKIKWMRIMMPNSWPIGIDHDNTSRSTANSVHGGANLCYPIIADESLQSRLTTTWDRMPILSLCAQESATRA